MKIALIFSKFCTGSRPLDFIDLWNNPRGLTGSDLGLVMCAKELHKLGHEISLFCDKIDYLIDWDGVKLINIDQLNETNTKDFDALISWSDPNVFEKSSQQPYKICYTMLNDFSYCFVTAIQKVDKWIGVSKLQIDHLLKLPNAPSKIDIIPLGCSPEIYQDKRVFGRMIWTSSPDRGLHWLLQEFPKIKKAIPQAHLKIFYNFNYDSIINIEPNANYHFTILEMSNRARYMLEAIKKLKNLGVDHIGSVSYNQMTQEYNQASILAFPCSTIAFTEGFSCSVLQSAASYTVPIITDQDCLGDVYKDSGAIIIKSPVQNNLQEFTDSVIKSLSDQQYADNIIKKCRKFSEKLTWENTAKQLENIIICRK